MSVVPFHLWNQLWSHNFPQHYSVVCYVSHLIVRQYIILQCFCIEFDSIFGRFYSFLVLLQFSNILLCLHSLLLLFIVHDLWRIIDASTSLSKHWSYKRYLSLCKKLRMHIINLFIRLFGASRSDANWIGTLIFLDPLVILFNKILVGGKLFFISLKNTFLLHAKISKSSLVCIVHVYSLQIDNSMGIV